jgi:protoheme IX farnesyltransferase
VSRLARYAWFVLFFNVGVILAGALVRATGSGAGCGQSWPTCQGEVIPSLDGATAIEFTHRTVSGFALILVVVLVVWVWRSLNEGQPARLGALLALVAIIGEALIGAVIVLAEWVADDASVARAVAVPLHLVNTLFLLAALALTAFWLGGGNRLDLSSKPTVTRAVIVGGVALILIAASGAVTALADTLFPGEGIDADFSAGAHFLTRLRVIHPMLAVGTAILGWWFSGKGSLPRTRSGRALPILVGLMLVTGAMNVLLGVPVWMQLIHLALADALWIAYVLTSAHSLQPTPTSISA